MLVKTFSMKKILLFLVADLRERRINEILD